jgi:hypothetical protein
MAISLAEFLRKLALDDEEDHYLNEIPDDEVLDYFIGKGDFLLTEALCFEKLHCFIVMRSDGSSSFGSVSE